MLDGMFGAYILLLWVGFAVVASAFILRVLARSVLLHNHNGLRASSLKEKKWAIQKNTQNCPKMGFPFDFQFLACVFPSLILGCGSLGFHIYARGPAKETPASSGKHSCAKLAAHVQFEVSFWRP